MLSGTLTGKYLSHNTRDFTGKDGTPITFTEVTFLYPDSQTKTATFTLSKDSDISVLDKLSSGTDLTISFEYREWNKEYKVTIDDKTKSIWVRKPRLVLSTKPIQK